MVTESAIPPRSREARLTGVMLLVLGVSVGGAWWFVRARGSLAEVGAEIVQQIRRQGLGRYWPRPTVRWFLTRSNGRAVGWRLLARAMREGNEFEGLEIVSIRGQGQSTALTWAYWSLGSHAGRGSYRSEVITVQQVGPLQKWSTQGETHVDVENGTIEISQKLGREQFQSTARTPPNYLPEGALPLARALVAADKTEGLFKLTYDHVPPVRGVPQFFSVKLRTVDLASQRGAAAAVRQTGTGVPPATYFLDADGITVRKTSADTVEDSVTAKEVLAEFPGAAKLITHALQGQKEPLALMKKLLSDEAEPPETP